MFHIFFIFSQFVDHRASLSPLCLYLFLSFLLSLSLPLSLNISPLSPSPFLSSFSLLCINSLFFHFCVSTCFSPHSLSLMFSPLSLSLSLSPLSLLSLSLSHFTRRDLSNVKPSYKQFVSNHVCLCNFEKKLFS